MGNKIIHRQTSGVRNKTGEVMTQCGRAAITAGAKIATWNVNSIRQREADVARWVQNVAPDVLFLQEIKCEAWQLSLRSILRRWATSLKRLDKKRITVSPRLSRIPFSVTHRRLPGLP